MFLAPASDGRRSEATFAGIETGTALMLMPMVLAQLPAAGKPSKDLQRPTLVDEAIRFVDALLDGGAPGPASARVATLRDTVSAPTNEPTLELVVTSRSRPLAVLRVLSARDRFRLTAASRSRVVDGSCYRQLPFAIRAV